MLGYLGERITGAKDGGVGHGSTAALLDVCRPFLATAKPSDVLYRTTATRRL